MALELITTADMKQFMHEIRIETKALVEKMKQSDSQEFMTSTEVCDLLRITSGTLRTYRRKDMVKFTRVGGNLLYKRLDIEAMLFGKRA